MDFAPGSAIASKVARLNRANRVSAVVGISMLTLVVSIAIWALQETASSEYWVSHTYQVISASHQLSFDIKDTQASIRAYLLQPTDQYRAELEAATSRVNASFLLLRSLTADNAGQQARLDRLEPLLLRRRSRLQELISIRDSAGLDRAERLREERLGKPDADEMWSLCKEIQEEEYGLAAQREHLRHVRLIEGMSGTIGSALLALTALFVSSLQVRRAVHDLIRTDHERHQSESMVASLFEAAPEAILVVDKAGRIVRTNPEIEHLFGYRREELIDQSVAILVPDSQHQKLEDLMSEFFNASESKPVNRRAETKLLKKNSREFFAAMSVGRILTTTGDFAVAFVSDISQRRADEETLRANEESLRNLTGKLLTAQEDERRRIARNLHDDLNQSLACLAMDLGRLEENDSAQNVSAELALLRDRTREAAELVRNISHQLHPSTLEDLGLTAAIAEYCEEFQDRTGIETHFDCGDLPNTLSSNAISCVYYVVTESLRNVAKHAQASAAQVIAEIDGKELKVTVIDDGLGFAPNSGRSGIGITAMRERLHLVGGHLSFEPAAGRGAQIVAALPFS